MNNNFAWATLVTKPNYEVCAGRLYQSLKYFKSEYPLEILVSDDLKDSDIPFLIANNIPFKKIKKIVFYPDPFNGRIPIYNDTFSKLLVLNLKQYDYICFIDADILITANIDYLWKNVDIDKSINCYCRQPNNIPGGELFFINPNLTSVNDLIKFVNIYTKLNTDKWIKNDEVLFKLYYKDTINKINISFENIIHCSGYIKFWTVLYLPQWISWFWEDPIEDFIRKLLLNSDLISELIMTTSKIVEIQLGNEPFEKFKCYDD